MFILSFKFLVFKIYIENLIFKTIFIRLLLYSSAATVEASAPSGVSPTIVFIGRKVSGADSPQSAAVRRYGPERPGCRNVKQLSSLKFEAVIVTALKGVEAIQLNLIVITTK